jgi:hypothetical protein
LGGVPNIGKIGRFFRQFEPVSDYGGNFFFNLHIIPPSFGEKEKRKKKKKKEKRTIQKL